MGGKWGKGIKKRDCSSASLPAQQELFLDSKKQRRRIVFHPPCNYEVSPPNVVFKEFCVAMFSFNLQ